MSSPAVLSLACQPSNPTRRSLRNISASSSWLNTGIASSPVVRIFKRPLSFLAISQYVEPGYRPGACLDACSPVGFARVASLSGADVSVSESRSFGTSLNILYPRFFFEICPPDLPTGHLLFLDGSRFLARKVGGGVTRLRASPDSESQ